MKKQLVIIVIMVVILVIGLSGCFESTDKTNTQLTDQEKIVGTWKFFTGEGSIYNFFPNGTYTKTNEGIEFFENGTYAIEDGKLSIRTYFTADYSSETIYDYWFSHDDNRLTIRREGSVADEPYDRQ